jgi:molybdopterin synthase catalytic subunit
MNLNIKIVDKIDYSKIYETLSHESSGGICIFIGTVRNMTCNELVHELFFEAYEAMAISEMEKIAKEAIVKWNLNKIIMHHVIGIKKAKEPVVIVGTSSAHRDACFEATRFLIDTLKRNVPIWKKEVFKNKKTWITNHP